MKYYLFLYFKLMHESKENNQDKLIENTSYILIFREINEDRIINLFLCLKECLRLFNGKLEIILVNQDKKPYNIERTNYLKKKILKLKFYNDIYDGFFNRGRALNFGIKKSNKKYIICGDIDIPLRENIFYLLEKMKDYDFINPYHRIVNLNKIEKELLKNNKTNIELLLKDIPKERKKGEYTFSGGVLICNKKRLEELNNFKEFPHYGCEDRHFDVVLDVKKEKCLNDNYVYIHYYHDKSYITDKHRLKINSGIKYLESNFGCSSKLDNINFNKPISNHKRCKHKLPID